MAGEGFVPAGRLAVGNAVVTRAGPPAVVVAIEHRRLPLVVHNLRVEGAHTYFVGLSGGGVWVHNQACPVPSFPFERAARIFRNASGHVNPSTAASMQRRIRMFQQVASNPVNLRPGASPAPGVDVYTQRFQNGEVWVHVCGGVISNAGVNP